MKYLLLTNSHLFSEISNWNVPLYQIIICRIKRVGWLLSLHQLFSLSLFSHFVFAMLYFGKRLLYTIWWDRKFSPYQQENDYYSKYKSRCILKLKLELKTNKLIQQYICIPSDSQDYEDQLDKYCYSVLLFHVNSRTPSIGLVQTESTKIRTKQIEFISFHSRAHWTWKERY